MAKAAVCYGGVSVQYQLRELCRGCNILIGTPGRLLDFISKEKVREKIFKSIIARVKLKALLPDT